MSSATLALTLGIILAHGYSRLVGSRPAIYWQIVSAIILCGCWTIWGRYWLLFLLDGDDEGLGFLWILLWISACYVRIRNATLPQYRGER